MNNSHRWYVVYTRPNGEKTAKHNLIQQGFSSFMPQYLKRRCHARRIDWVPAPMFPRYLFVGMDPATARWRAISSTIGVSHLVCKGGIPLPVPEGIVEDLQASTGADDMIEVEPLVPFRQGEPVQVLSGAMADQVGFFDCATDEGRVILLLDMLGRQVRVKVPLDSVATVA